VNVLVIDIGGTHVKIKTPQHRTPVKIDSGPKMTPAKMAFEVQKASAKWKYDRISIGYPGVVVHNKPVHEPYNLAPGWIGFDYANAFKKSVKIMNDAAMQALGSYEGGRMLFFGLGTGLGSAMVVDGIVQPMELAHLPYKGKKTYEDVLGLAGLKKLGKKKWSAEVLKVCTLLQAAMDAEYIVLGGGNVDVLKKLPENIKRGSNENAFKGGVKMWSKPHLRKQHD
jgi:polyphosphate glucokinase